ncbi:hypothetical protein SAMN05421504_10927 [Amycolatopsis xylanica]|uniref:Uncharacterized protein n=1 Tax=Amycolatopsis xylanica TaxID=589385 RepID=A0A1H3Q0Q3_9PSEU|nr:hypothetical protein [Amycolatopsis xylanica]SDZ06801.1 hypothetical protein SAMN05421504_10927 [Amycolatopsis xylanica]
MNLEQLAGELAKAGVDPRSYHFPGKQADGPLHDSAVYLEADGAGWTVGVRERGVNTPRQSFDTEDAACRYMYDLLTWKAPEPVRLTPEEAEAARLLNERIQAENLRDLRERKARYDAEH